MTPTKWKGEHGRDRDINRLSVATPKDEKTLPVNFAGFQALNEEQATVIDFEKREKKSQTHAAKGYP